MRPFTYPEITPSKPVKLRSGPVFQTAFHLISGDPVCAFLSPHRPFEDNCRFGSAAPAGPHLKTWFLGELEQLAQAARTKHLTTRPFVLPLPDAAFCEASLPALAEEALQSTQLCPQEVSFEFSDAALIVNANNVLQTVRAYRRHGFRISIDARRCWQSTVPGDLWFMVDTLRIDPVILYSESSLEDRIETANEAGVSIIAERPAWREGPMLANLGIEYGVRPVTDA